MARIARTPDRDPREEWPVREAKQAYVAGDITLAELEDALEQRLGSGSFSPLPDEDPTALLGATRTY